MRSVKRGLMASVVMRAFSEVATAERTRWGASTGRIASRLGVLTHEEHKEWRVAGFPQYNPRQNEWGVSEAHEERRVADSPQYNRRG